MYAPKLEEFFTINGSEMELDPRFLYTHDEIKICRLIAKGFGLEKIVQWERSGGCKVIWQKKEK